MQITSKKQLQLYLCADYMMNRGKFNPSIIDRVRNLFSPDYIMSYLVAMRKTSYYKGAFFSVNIDFYGTIENIDC